MVKKKIYCIYIYSIKSIYVYSYGNIVNKEYKIMDNETKGEIKLDYSLLDRRNGINDFRTIIVNSETLKIQHRRTNKRVIICSFISLGAFVSLSILCNVVRDHCK